MNMKSKSLIIEIKYSGLGDHLFHSHIPRIAKESKIYDKVFISEKSIFGHSDYKKLIWELNPYVDGFTDESGIICDIAKQVAKLDSQSETNLLDQIMYFYGLDNGCFWNQPEVYYQPKNREEFHYTIFDPNFVSWIGNVTAEDAMIFFRNNKINFERIMKLRDNKIMYIPSGAEVFIETPTLFDFCDLIYSAKTLFCLTSGTATLAAALDKSAKVFYGVEQLYGFQHYKRHDYINIPRDFKSRVVRKIKSLF